MPYPHPGPGMGGLAPVLSLLIHGFFFIVMLAVVVGLIFLLVRFLLVATKAARIYIDRNGASTGTATAAPATPAVAKTSAPRNRSTPRQN
jgi:hypothetical protein